MDQQTMLLRINIWNSAAVRNRELQRRRRDDPHRILKRSVYSVGSAVCGCIGGARHLGVTRRLAVFAQIFGSIPVITKCPFPVLTTRGSNRSQSHSYKRNAPLQEKPFCGLLLVHVSLHDRNVSAI